MTQRSYRRGVTPKTLNPRDLVSIGRRLKSVDARKPYSSVRGKWHDDTGRRLFNYRRLHASLRRFFPGKSLAGKQVVHLGAGNNMYMHFLAEEFRVKPTSIDINRRIISRARRAKLKSNPLRASASKIPLRANSQDIVISDHFLFSKFFAQGAEKDISATRSVLKESFRILKPGGVLFIERASPVRGKNVYDKSDYERPYLDRANLEGFEVVESVEGLHDYPDSVIRPHKSFGFTDLDLHPMMDLVVLRKPTEGEGQFFNPLSLFLRTEKD